MAYKEDMAGIPIVGQVPISNPGNASKVVIFNGNLYIWNGITWNSTDASNTSYILKIYRDIVSDISNSELIPGATYVITDYQTVHFFLDGNNTIPSDVNIGPIEPIVVTATSENTISSIAYSLVYPQDILHYDWNPDNWKNDISFSDIQDTGDVETSSVVDGFKGVITYREDTIKNNITHFDFRSVKNRRWAIDLEAMEWNNSTTYTKNSYSYRDAAIYKSLKAGNTNNDVGDTNWWVKLLDCEFDKYWSWDQVNFFSMPIDGLDYVDRYTFDGDVDADGKFANNFIGLKSGIEFYPNYNSLIPNIVYYIEDDGYDNQCINNYIGVGEVSGNITFTGKYFKDNIIAKSYFNNNAIGSSFASNIIGVGFIKNIINYSFQNNNIADSFNNNAISSNFASNSVGNYFSYNTIGENFQNNIIGKSFVNNTIGKNFAQNNVNNYFNINTIGNNVINNIIGSGAAANLIGDSFEGNIIGNNCKNNYIGTYFKANTIGNSLGLNGGSYNQIGNYFMYNTVGNKVTKLVTQNKSTENLGFTYNTIKDNVNFNGVDFSAATLVFSNYNTEISTRADGALRLKYINNSDTEVITTVNS